MITKGMYDFLKHIPRLPNYAPAKNVHTKSKHTSDDFAYLVNQAEEHMYIIVQGKGADARFTLRDKGHDRVQEYKYSPRRFALAAMVFSIISLLTTIILHFA